MAQRIAGVDGCKAGWLCLERSDGTDVAATVFESTEALMEHAGTLDVMTIDIPIGLPDDGPRAVDRIARTLVGPRASSVFPCPVRATLEARDYAEACARSRAACGKALSQQAYAILPRIRAVDSALRRDARLRARVREVHPELCFYHLNEEQPLPDSKKTEAGFLMRHALLEAQLGAFFAPIRERIARSVADHDDILDAAVALWSAQRLLDGTVVIHPTDPPFDRFGLRMEMIA